MDTFNFSKNVSFMRRKKGFTQEQLANFLGVSKAAVSKWETGLSYPDFSLLPRLASFFNITIDELLGYKPQLNKEEIKSLYEQYASDFTTKPFDEVYEQIDTKCKEYYSCFPLLMQMGVLLLNHLNIAGAKQQTVIDKTIELNQQIIIYSDDLSLTNKARSILASCHLMLQQPKEVLALLGDIEPFMGNEVMIANAYQMLQDGKKAKETLQISLFSNLISIISIAPNYLMMHLTNPTYFEEIIHRMEQLIKIFDIENLHFNSAAVFYISAAQCYMQLQMEDHALLMIERYANLCGKTTHPITLHGDEFFDLLDDWIEKEIDLGSNAPRDQKMIKKDIVLALTDNPIFSSLQERVEFQDIVSKLNFQLGSEKNDN